MSNSEETADNSAEKKPENEEKSDEISSPDVETRFTLDITATNLEDKNKEEEEEGRNEEEGEDKTDKAEEEKCKKKIGPPRLNTCPYNLGTASDHQFEFEN
ncbi:neurofilament medium polypeptide-like [Periplaneta americana]|uniref:neurofilament medium polypeptide-like n=1 Tax=Periplaneta americana TaxID=6978 RepID=UPI0037E80BA5